MSRLYRRYRTLCDQYHAGHDKPPTRKQAQAWLAPIRRAFVQIKSGEVDAYRGYPITRIHHADNDFARIDHCINGFVAMLNRLSPDFDTSPMTRIAKKLEAGALLTVPEIDACFAALNDCEDLLLTFSRAQLKDAAQVEQINIEFERMGIKEAA